jgi:hypothetical protein
VPDLKWREQGWATDRVAQPVNRVHCLVEAVSFKSYFHFGPGIFEKIET